MRWQTAIMASVAAFGLLGAWVSRADETADRIAAQKKRALANLAAMEISQPAQVESKSLLLYSSLPEARLRPLSTILEEQFTAARKALKFEDKEPPWPGKLTVYVFPEREQFTSFLRSVEKRRPEAEEFGSHSLEGDQPHVAAGPATSKDGPSMETQAGAQVGAILLQKKAPRAELPAWLVEGFGRATVYHTARGGYTASRRRLTARALLAKTSTVKDVWSGTLKEDETRILATSLMYYLAYGPAAGRLPSIVVGFNPTEEKPTMTMDDALTAAKVSVDVLERRWQAWLRMR